MPAEKLRLAEAPGEGLGQRGAAGVEGVEQAVVDDVVGGLEVFTAADVDGREGGEGEPGGGEEGHQRVSGRWRPSTGA